MKFRAFFSYARADDRIANWLHRQIDRYRTPMGLVGQTGDLGPIPKKLHPIFRDRTDLQAGGHIDASLQQALEDSETLVVLCTPVSAKSHWVNHECETFLGLGRETRIFPIIAAGQPDSADPETECFPPVLRGKGLLAADLRAIRLPNGQLIGDGREGGRLKLIAGLLGVPLDKLVQRERRRQRVLLTGATSVALCFAAVAVAATLFAHQAEVQRSRAEMNMAALADASDRADESIALAMDTANNLVAYASDLADIPQMPHARAEQLIDQALSIQARLAAAGAPDSNRTMIRAQTLNAAARAYIKVGDLEKAMNSVTEANRIFAELLGRHPQNRELQDELAGTYEGISEIKFRGGDPAGAIAALDIGLPMLRKLAENGDALARRHLAFGLARRGLIFMVAHPAAAAPQLTQAFDIFCALSKERPNSEAQSDAQMSNTIAVRGGLNQRCQ